MDETEEEEEEAESIRGAAAADLDTLSVDANAHAVSSMIALIISRKSIEIHLQARSYPLLCSLYSTLMLSIANNIRRSRHKQCTNLNSIQNQAVNDK